LEQAIKELFYLGLPMQLEFLCHLLLTKGGTFILDVNDRKVKISKNNGTWFDLTVHNLEKPATGGNTAIDNSLQTNAAFPEKTDAKTMIGGNPTTDSTPEF
jgi:hypothetical protein